MANLQCQKCRTPLRIDGSLQDINPASFKILADAAAILEPNPPGSQHSAEAKERRQLYDEVSSHAGSPIHKRNISAGQRGSGGKMAPDMSYIMLSDSHVASDAAEEVAVSPPRKKPGSRKPEGTDITDGQSLLSQRMETTIRLFETLSARSDIDHPVCSECTELLLEGLLKRQASVTRERDAYVEFLKQAQQDLPSEEDRYKTKQDLEDSQRREKKALEELETLEAEKARMEAEIAALDLEAEELDEAEEQFWHKRNAFTAELNSFYQERDSLQNQLVHDAKVLEALQRTNVYNDAFCIGHDGIFGTINGLRLGRQPDHPVEWSEINAAWGQTLLVLSVIIEKLKVSLKGYELIPVGSSSKVVKIDLSQAASTADGRPKKSILELYSSGDLPLGLGFLHRNFDSAMVAFLECLRQVGEHVELTTNNRPGVAPLKLPYTIVRDKIGDVSIKLGNFGQEEQWTKACKYTLTCCKFLLAHASHTTDTRESKTARRE